MQKKPSRRNSKRDSICNRRKLFLMTTALFLSVVFNFAAAQPADFPVPTGNAKQLFFLQRTPNINTIVCELNYKNGAIDKEDPVHVFWVLFQEGAKRQDLTYIQRKFAYGISAKEIGANKYELNFVSYKKYKMYLMLGADKQFHVYTTVNNKQILLSHIFVEIRGGSFWTPHVEYVEISGTDPTTHVPIKERFKI